MNHRLSSILFILAVAATTLPAPAAFAQSRKKVATRSSSVTLFRGCLQGDPTKGFALLSPKSNPDGTTGQMKTYRVVAGQKIDLQPMANKVVEITGTLSTAQGAAHSIPSTDALGGREIVDSVRTAPTSPEQGTQMWADGTLTARSVRQVENSCAVGSDKKD
jgi:hypothetical protein